MSNNQNKKIAIIAGAGPAGLTAAYELSQRTDIIPIIFEKTGDIGGISKTVNYKGNHIDIGGHRFFSKSERVMDWWLHILPMEEQDQEVIKINYQNKETQVKNEGHRNPKTDDKVMLVRQRLSRIYYLKKFFSYPVTLSIETLKNLGLIRSANIFFSYIQARIFPIRKEKNLEDFMINRFGKVLYRTFFKDYTEKVWGTPCNEISAEWGAQRIKGVSISKAIRHAIKQMAPSPKRKDINQKDTETSLIERFLYPKYGPGQMWETVAELIEAKTAEPVRHHSEVVGINYKENKISSVIIKNLETGTTTEQPCDYFFSTMPIRQHITSMNPTVPSNVLEVAQGLIYRDFLTVGLLLDKLKVKHNAKLPAGKDNMVKDNWIYIQEKEVQVGRLQIFNNWSPYMIQNPDHVWVGMEYFCNKGDHLWDMADEDLKQLGINELATIEIIDKKDVLDATVLRMPKAYPAYFGTYNRLEEVKEYVKTIENLFLVGRNGMHKYNNSDHSMLTAMVAVDQIIDGKVNQEHIWAINTEMEYHEEK